MTNHEVYMMRCLELASMGFGNTAPNPMVGSLIILNDKIIGEGYHMQYGGPHAEVNAVNSVKDKSVLGLSTLYVNLEPCTHTGKTPPCSDMIISKGIKNVVIGTSDPNPVVNGKGIEKLKKAGFNVITNILPDKCYNLNKRFFTFHLKNRPYIILKWAQTKDGFIDIIRNAETPVQPNWISNEYSKMLVHKWRSEEQAILVGTNTAIFDNPHLTTREWSGKNAVRILIDRNLRVPKDSYLFDNTASTIIFNKTLDKHEKNNIFISMDLSDKKELALLMNELYKRDIQSLIVEGGKELLDSFIESDLWDEARVFTGNKRFRNGIKAPELYMDPIEEINLETDILSLYRKN